MGRTPNVSLPSYGRQDAPHATRVEEVFARNQIVFEPREIAQADEVTVKYHAWLDSRTSLDDLSAELMRDVSGLRAVSWEHPKRV